MAPPKGIPQELHQYLLEEKEDELPYDCLICGNRPFFIGHIEKSNPNRISAGEHFHAECAKMD